MKVHFLFCFCKVLLLAILMLGKSVGLSAYNPDLTWELGTAPGEIIFSLMNIEPLPGNNDLERYRVFWSFGDGTYQTDTLTQAQTLNYQVPHPYQQMDSPPEDGILHARVELTKIYTPPDDEDAPLLLYATADNDPDGPIMYDLFNTFGFSQDPGVDRNLHGEQFRADFSRNPRYGSGMNYMITYQLDQTAPCNLPLIGGEMKVGYTRGLVLDEAFLDESVPSPVEVFHGEEVSPTQDEGYWHYTYIYIPRDPAGNGEQRELIFNFHTPSETEDPFCELIIFLEDSSGNSCRTEQLDQLTILNKEQPYDPNFKRVSKDSLTADSAQWLNYVIQFQNTGNAPTDSITVVDILDPRLDPTTVFTLGAVMGFEQVEMAGVQSIPEDDLPRIPFSFKYEESVIGNVIEWKLFNTGRLRGTGEEEFRVDFVERETIGQIYFRVKTRYFEETNVTIPNSANVYFDSLPPIRTEPAYTYKFCCCCEERTQGDSINIDLLQYVDTTWSTSVDSLYKVALTTDSISNPNQQPQLTIDNGGSASYIADSSFNGMDLLEFAACYKDGGSLICDTFQVAICVDVAPRLFVCPEDSLGVAIEDALPTQSLYFSLGPNPFTDHLTLFANSLANPIRQVAMYNLQGAQVLSHKGEHFEPLKINTGHLPPGVYFLRVNEQEIFKVIKQ